MAETIKIKLPDGSVKDVPGCCPPGRDLDGILQLANPFQN